MRKLLSLLWLVALISGQTLWAKSVNEPDSAYIFAYSTQKSNGHSGLLFAWSSNHKSWNSIGPEFRFLFSDYGRWGSEKRLVSPYLFQGPDHLWHCLWSLNETDGVFAHATSKDLIYWKPQTYPEVMKGGNCLQPEFLTTKPMLLMLLPG